MAGGNIRLRSAELLVKGGDKWRELTAKLTVPLGAITGVNVYNKVYFIGKELIFTFMVRTKSYLCRGLERCRIS